MANIIPVVEMFGPTIQGEGSVIGTQTFFIRFGGCDYNCERCDSLHAVIPERVKANSMYLKPEEIVKEFKSLARRVNAEHIPWVTFSGGNPCIWPLESVVRDLTVAGYTIALETQGSIWTDWIRECHKVTVSPKGPGMGEKFEPEKFRVFVEELRFHPGFSVKVVVFDQRDIEFMADILNTWPELRYCMYASIGNVNPPAPAKRDAPETITYEEFVIGTLNNMRIMTEEILQDKRLGHVKILPQLHTLIWGNKQGV